MNDVRILKAADQCAALRWDSMAPGVAPKVLSGLDTVTPLDWNRDGSLMNDMTSMIRGHFMNRS
jgi:hypothetical protein